MIALPVFLALTSPLFTGHADPNPTVAATELPSALPSTHVAPATLPSPAVAPTPITTPVPGVTPGPGATPATGLTPAGATPAAGAAPAIVPADATYQYRFIPSQPRVLAPGQPQIFAVYLNNKRLRSAGQIAIRVLTSPNVVKVVTSSNGRVGVIPNVAPGDFQANSKLPKLPFVASGITTTIDFIATSSTGKKVTVGVPVELQ